MLGVFTTVMWACFVLYLAADIFCLAYEKSTGAYKAHAAAEAFGNAAVLFLLVAIVTSIINAFVA